MRNQWLARIGGITVVAAVVWYGTRLWFHGSPFRMPFAIAALVGVVAGLWRHWRVKRDALARRSREREAGFWRATFPRAGGPPNADAG